MQNARSSLMAFQCVPLAVVMGTNEIASAVAVALNRSGYAVVLSHDPSPPVIRRGMAFYDALFGDPCEVGGLIGERAEDLLEIADVLTRRERVAVTPLTLTDLLALRAADVLVEARMQKQVLTPDFRRLARLTIGLGPKFAVGLNCDIAIETLPARAGALVEKGATADADGQSRNLGGVGRERFLYSDRPGIWRSPIDIGMWVPKDFVLGRLDGLPARAPMDGFIRGVVRDGVSVPAGVKILEIDPRKRAACWTGTDERGRSLAQACLKAIRQRERARVVDRTLVAARSGLALSR